jgi:putative nucleotidyltransferase with HDIG domain
MDETQRRVAVEDLRAGMGIVAITRLSNEYSYLDSRRVARLKQRFAGAKVTAVRDGQQEVVPIESIYAGDQIVSILALPPALGFGAIDDAAAAFLKEQGFREFLVQGNGAGAPEVPEAPVGAPGGPPGGARPVTAKAPTFASARGMNHKKRVAEVRYFLERVEEAETSRYESTGMLKELFEQGRAGKFSSKPAEAAVESILRKDVGAAMAAVAGLKSSDQTFAHCIDMATILTDVANSILRATGKPPDERVSRSTLAAGFMHDIGKSQIPREILDSTERFGPDSREMQIIRSHVEHSARILTAAGADQAMINMAHYHHVKTDTSLPASYPAVSFDEVLPLTRLAAIVDVYQALTGRRSYKRNWVPGKAVQYLRELSGSEFDAQMLRNLLKVIGTYPVGSLVRLSTGDAAFVTKVEGQDSERPVVVVVENAQGELLSTHPLVDLMEEPELSVVEVIDHYEHYDDYEDQAFRLFKSLKVV